VIEPEQIRLQVYATLSAGCRAVGYWTTDRLDDTSAPGALERKLVIEQLNREIDLIEPWLATGSVISHVPFTLVQKQSPLITQLGADFKNSGSKRLMRDEQLAEREMLLQQKKEAATEMQASIIHSEYGTLILPVWYRRKRGENRDPWWECLCFRLGTEQYPNQKSGSETGERGRGNITSQI